MTRIPEREDRSMDEYTTEELEEMDEMMELEESEPSVNQQKAAGFLILCVVFLPVIFLASLDAYIYGAAGAAFLMWGKPWWWRQETHDRMEGRAWGR